jgi:hypothetical protein
MRKIVSEMKDGYEYSVESCIDTNGNIKLKISVVDYKIEVQ